MLVVSAIDIAGDSLYVLFHTEGNSRGDDMFFAAALTRKTDIERSEHFDLKRDKVVVLSIKDMADIKTQTENIIKEHSQKYGPTVEFGIWSHAAVHGPTGTDPTSSYSLDEKQMTLEGWSKIDFNWGENARAGFYGCKTGVDPPWGESIIRYRDFYVS